MSQKLNSIEEEYIKYMVRKYLEKIIRSGKFQKLVEKKVIRKLVQKKREMVINMYKKGFTIDTISKTLKVPKTTIKFKLKWEKLI